MSEAIMQQDEISDNNADYWDELCGTNLAISIGVTDSSPQSLKKFDDWYFKFYPYLTDYIPFEDFQGKDVLEIGLGYGTVAQRIAASDANYTGLDIAKGPVAMANHRLQQNNLAGQAVQGSILKPEFKSQSFDYIVAIGCLHHTGDLQLAINNCYELLKPGGQLIFMVYSAYSYRRWLVSPFSTTKYWFKELLGKRDVVGPGSKRDRAIYDANTDGASAPHTDWISKKSLKALCSRFQSFHSSYDNITNELIFMPIAREKLLNTSLPKVMGLDLYATATK